MIKAQQVITWRVIKETTSQPRSPQPRLANARLSPTPLSFNRLPRPSLDVPPIFQSTARRTWLPLPRCREPPCVHPSASVWRPPGLPFAGDVKIKLARDNLDDAGRQAARLSVLRHTRLTFHHRRLRRPTPQDCRRHQTSRRHTTRRLHWSSLCSVTLSAEVSVPLLCSDLRRHSTGMPIPSYRPDLNELLLNDSQSAGRKKTCEQRRH